MLRGYEGITTKGIKNIKIFDRIYEIAYELIADMNILMELNPTFDCD